MDLRFSWLISQCAEHFSWRVLHFYGPMCCFCFCILKICNLCVAEMMKMLIIFSLPPQTPENIPMRKDSLLICGCEIYHCDMVHKETQMTCLNYSVFFCYPLLYGITCPLMQICLISKSSHTICLSHQEWCTFLAKNSTVIFVLPGIHTFQLCSGRTNIILFCQE